jgi:hypothetical protein
VTENNALATLLRRRVIAFEIEKVPKSDTRHNAIGQRRIDVARNDLCLVRSGPLDSSCVVAPFVDASCTRLADDKRLACQADIVAIACRRKQRTLDKDQRRAGRG